MTSELTTLHIKDKRTRKVEIISFPPGSKPEAFSLLIAAAFNLRPDAHYQLFKEDTPIFTNEKLPTSGDYEIEIPEYAEASTILNISAAYPNDYGLGYYLSLLNPYNWFNYKDEPSQNGK